MRVASLVLCVLVLSVLVAGCEWKVPITATGTRDVLPALIGDWFLTTNGSRLHVRRYDSRNYVVGEGAHGDNLFTAHHSDLGDWQLLSARRLKPEGDVWTWMQWRLLDEDHLELRVVSEKVIPETLTDPDEIGKLLKANRQKPELLGPAMVYARER